MGIEIVECSHVFVSNYLDNSENDFFSHVNHPHIAVLAHSVRGPRVQNV